MSTVVITQNRKNIERAVDEALQQLPLGPLLQGKVVAVKPNETWATEDDTTAVTQAAEVSRPSLAGIIATRAAPPLGRAYRE